MSSTLILWLLLFAGLTLAAFKRPAYAVAGYMLSFFLCPPFWWWGGPIEGIRWNFYSGLVLLAVVLLSSPRKIGSLEGNSRRVFLIAVFILANATFVNFALASNTEISTEAYFLLAKFFLLCYLIYASIKSKFDMQIVMMSMILGAAYIGFEVTVNERGELEGNRLEGVGAPGANTANHFASLMVAVLPLVAPFFLVGNIYYKSLAVICAPLIVNVVLLCNSRGAFLAAIMSAIVFLAMAPKGVRKKAWVVVIAGGIGTFMLMGDARILDRFMSTFAAEEERDSSAQSRVELVKAGLDMIADYPLGAGGDSFKKVHGVKYLIKRGISNVPKAIHNGYLNETCGWGIQGGLLRVAFFGFAIFATWRHLKDSPVDPETEFERLAACSFMAGLSALLVTSLFGNHLDSEWGMWMVGLMVAVIAITPIDGEWDEEEEQEAEFEDDETPLELAMN